MNYKIVLSDKFRKNYAKLNQQERIQLRRK